jgi:hypothetical protein
MFHHNFKIYRILCQKLVRILLGQNNSKHYNIFITLICVTLGPLSAAFRARVTYAVYLIIAAVGFLILGIIIGIPTLILKPAKFVFW